MKVRLDYVTNSSATGYIVCVPRTFDPSNDEIMKALEDMPYFTIGEFDDKEVDEILKDIKDCVINLQSGQDVYQYDTPGEAFYATSYLLRGFVLGDFDIHSDGDGLIMQIKPEVIEEIFMEFHKMNIREMVEGGEHVTAENKQQG